MGSINTFEEQELAIREMLRVARPDAKIVIVDEGLDSSSEIQRGGRSY